MPFMILGPTTVTVGDLPVFARHLDKLKRALGRSIDLSGSMFGRKQPIAEAVPDHVHASRATIAPLRSAA
jgi:hypothetical protein